MKVVETVKEVVKEAVKEKLKPTYEGEGEKVISWLVYENGGLEGLVEKFSLAGYGDTFMSWVDPGINRYISSEDILRIFGAEQIQELASRFFIDDEELAKNLSIQLPEWVNSLEIEGRLTTDLVKQKLSVLKH